MMDCSQLTKHLLVQLQVAWKYTSKCKSRTWPTFAYKSSLETQSHFYFQSYQQTILLPQRRASFLQFIKRSQQFRVLTHQDAVVSAVLENKNKSKFRTQQKTTTSFLRKTTHKTNTLSLFIGKQQCVKSISVVHLKSCAMSCDRKTIHSLHCMRQMFTGLCLIVADR